MGGRGEYSKMFGGVRKHGGARGTMVAKKKGQSEAKGGGG